MKAPFKAGDKIVANDKCGRSGSLIKGQQYTVVRCYPVGKHDDDYRVVLDERPPGENYYYWRFDLVKKACIFKE